MPQPDIRLNLVHLYLTREWGFVLSASAWITGFIVVLVAALVIFRAWKARHQRFDIVAMEISLGGIGKVELKPTIDDIQIAHRIWAEIVTRKGAIEFDPEHDVIVEVYDSWYVLFQKVRQLISDVPAHIVRRDKSTRQLVEIAVDTLNNGLRPHLTRWQARYRHWYGLQAEALRSRSPQEVQRDFPEYASLEADLLKISRQLREYSEALGRLARGE